jgi:hypothetical protein
MGHVHFILAAIAAEIMERFQCPYVPVVVELAESGHFVALAKTPLNDHLAVHADPSSDCVIWVSGPRGMVTIECQDDAMLYCNLSNTSTWRVLEIADDSMFDRLLSLIEELL